MKSSQKANSADQKGGCKEGLEHIRLSARYTTPKGIGYKQGYSTLEGFFAPRTPFRGTWLPFLDLRGHIFDNGKFAANAGMGLRYLSKSRIWGINSYYDYRNTSRQHYNQVSAGLETLGKIWDFRINGYLPVGWKNSPRIHTRFDTFKGHRMLLRRSREFSLKGANAEVGLHVDHFKNAPLYFAGGPYYLTGAGATTWGGEFRGAVEFFHRHLRLEGNVSYDHLFKWIGQGQISVNIRFGGRSKVPKRGNQSCSEALTLNLRSIQPVDRHEIIPVSKQKVISRAIDPATGKPYYFVFVDNSTSSSLGTFKDPYASLAEAEAHSSPGQIIYVFPGDGPYDTSYAGAAGLTLQDSQMLLGASTSHFFSTTIGNVCTPPMASSLPVITNPDASSNVITLANNNTVSGFYIEDSSVGISGIGISNFTATQNIFAGGVNNTNEIYLFDVSGKMLISSSTFNNIGNGNGIYIELQSGTLANLYVSKCSFDYMIDNDGSFNGNGIYAEIGNGTLANLIVSKSAFNNMADPSVGFGGSGVFADLSGGTLMNLCVSDSTFSNMSDVGSGIYTNIFDGTLSNWTVLNNTFSNVINGSFAVSCYLRPTPGTNTSVDISNNTFVSSDVNYSPWAALLEIEDGTTCLNFTHNNATLIPSIYAYQLTNFGGTYNTTPGSDNTTNTGLFEPPIGIINADGCTEGQSAVCTTPNIPHCSQ